MPDCDAEPADLTAEQLAAIAEQAESDAAEAEKVAAEARARADRLQQEHAGAAEESKRTWSRLPRPGRKRIVAVLAALCTAALLAASGYMIHVQGHLQAEQRQQAEFVAAARQVVVTLMSIDFTNPQQSVQRIVDNSTDPFRAEFQSAADDFIKVAQDAKVTTKASANAAAVESITAESAVVLVSASSTVTNEAGAVEAPRSWRLKVDMQREGDQIKMSKVEFVP